MVPLLVAFARGRSCTKYRQAIFVCSGGLFGWRTAKIVLLLIEARSGPWSFLTELMKRSSTLSGVYLARSFMFIRMKHEWVMFFFAARMGTQPAHMPCVTCSTRDCVLATYLCVSTRLFLEHFSRSVWRIFMLCAVTCNLFRRVVCRVHVLVQVPVFLAG